MLKQLATKQLDGVTIFLIHGTKDEQEVFTVTWKETGEEGNVRMYKRYGQLFISCGDLPCFTFRRQDRAAEFYNSVMKCQDGKVRFVALDYPKTRYKTDRVPHFWHAAAF